MYSSGGRYRLAGLSYNLFFSYGKQVGFSYEQTSRLYLIINIELT